MAAHSLDEDDIDTEALQAQIDLSLSFAQELVSSWVKPSRPSASKAQRRDTEQELKEYMRRPPRLGVGAPIPDTGVSSRETSRLKSQLTSNGKKRARDDHDQGPPLPVSDDEEESRAGAIRKKIKIDVFGSTKAGKKKKGGGNVNGIGTHLVAESQTPKMSPLKLGKAAEAGSDEEVEQALKDLQPDSSAPSPVVPSSKKKKRRNRALTDAGPSQLLPTNFIMATPVVQPKTSPTSLAGQREKYTTSPQTPSVVDLSLVSTPKPEPSIPRLAQAPGVGPSLLNLTGSPSLDHGPEDDKLVTPGKKRRKRRKKKRLMTIAHADHVQSSSDT